MFATVLNHSFLKTLWSFETGDTDYCSCAGRICIGSCWIKDFSCSAARGHYSLILLWGMSHNTFPAGDRSGLRANQSTNTLCLWSHAFVRQARKGLFLLVIGEIAVDPTSMVACHFQNSYIPLYNGFAPFSNKSLHGLKNWLIWLQNTTHVHILLSICPDGSAAFLCRVDRWLSPYSLRLCFWTQSCTTLSDNGFLSYSQAHETVLIMVSRQFLMKCQLRVQRSLTTNTDFCFFF